MYVFGGAKWPSEEIVNELWALNFNTQLWTSLSYFHPLSLEHDSILTEGDVDIIQNVSKMSFQPNTKTRLPLPVRSHTAHVTGSKMIILFGLSSGTETLISYVQEYDFGKLLNTLNLIYVCMYALMTNKLELCSMWQCAVLHRVPSFSPTLHSFKNGVH